MSVEDSPTSTTDNDVVDSATEELSKSALADNITKKGKNAYYYAHAHKATGPKVGIIASMKVAMPLPLPLMLMLHELFLLYAKSHVFSFVSFSGTVKSNHDC